jgi:hypothetical protein
VNVDVITLKWRRAITESGNPSAEDLSEIDDDSIYKSVDLSKPAFLDALVKSAIDSRDFARRFVSNTLPDGICYDIRFSCSYDGNPAEGDEKTFPNDANREPLIVDNAELVTQELWRDGFVPEWINVTVDRVDDCRTYIRLDCCGRFSATPEMMYHVHEGRPPFHVLSPPLSPHVDHENGEKFDLHWDKNA